jgi:hypothetical protein
MAEFCRKCLKKVMGLEPKEHPEWLVGKGGVCEECGSAYQHYMSVRIKKAAHGSR